MGASEDEAERGESNIYSLACEYLMSRGLDIDQIESQVRFYDLVDEIGADSLDLMGLFSFLEDRTGIRYPDDAAPPKTLAQLEDTLAKLRDAGPE